MFRSLIYFDFKGLGEGIRYLLYYGHLEFEDIRIPEDDWPINKDRFPFGKLPVYKEGHVTLHQSVAIARYIGYKLKLVPKDPLEKAKLDAVIYTFIDYIQILKTTMNEKDPAKKEKLNKENKTITTDFYFSKFEIQILDNHGFLNKELSWADIYFVGLVDMIVESMKIDITIKYPNIRSLCDKVHNLPGIKEHYEKSKKHVE